MKSIRIIAMGIFMGFTIAGLLFIPFTKYFITTTVYAFIVGWESQMGGNHLLMNMTLLFWLCMLSLSIGMWISALLYSPVERQIIQLLRKE